MVDELNDSFALRGVPLNTRATVYSIVYRKRLKEIRGLWRHREPSSNPA